MPRRTNRFSSAFSRMVVFSIVLTLGAQLVLAFIGLSYAASIKNGVTDKRKEAVLNQFQQNVRHQMNEVSNLLLLLQTPEFSFFYRNLMNLRDDTTVRQEKDKLLAKVEALHLRPDIVKEIYFIGENVNQSAFRKVTGRPNFEDLPVLRMENLRYSKLSDLFLRDQNQFTMYTPDELSGFFRTGSPLLDPQSIAALRAFQADIRDRSIITNGYDGVFIAIVLGDRFFEQALPPGGLDNFEVSVVNADRLVIWTTADQAGNAAVSAGRRLPEEDDPRLRSYARTVKDLVPFTLQIVRFDQETSPYLFRPSTLPFKMAALSVVTLLVTSFISVYFLKRVFDPFRLISRKLKAEVMSGDNVTGLIPLPEHWIRKGLHSVSLRNKLILVLFAAVSVPTIADGLLFSQWLSREVNATLESSVQATGRFAVVSMQDSVDAIETILNQISASEQFQNYVKAGAIFTSSPEPNRINLSMFPGLNDVSYFILLDENGNCVYSSIYSNNKDIFNTDTALLQDRSEPYWIASYKDVFNHVTAAAVKRIRPIDSDQGLTYLLAVPKETIFENTEFGQFNASYVIADESGHAIYRSRLQADPKSESLLRYSAQLPGKDWHLSIDYVFNEVIEKKRVYQEQFLLFIVIIFLMSTALAIVIANVLARPIRQMKMSMLAAGAGDFAERVDYGAHNEIGDIIRSYNRMIGRLDRTVRENFRIMEENARNKIKENQLLSMKTRAELQMLQAQINPHFLYNTLEIINMRSMQSGNQEVSTIVSALADLFRYSVAKGGEQVRMMDELNHAANYITIQQIRFGHSFEVEFDVPEELKIRPVLRFILQPILENAIKHGFAGWQSGGVIRVAAAAAGGEMRLTVGDNGVGMTGEALGRLRTEMEKGLDDWSGDRGGGIGLHNVYYRMKLFYQDRVTMTVTSELMKGTVIAIVFPLGQP